MAAGGGVLVSCVQRATRACCKALMTTGTSRPRPSRAQPALAPSHHPVRVHSTIHRNNNWKLRVMSGCENDSRCRERSGSDVDGQAVAIVAGAGYGHRPFALL